MPGKVEEFIGNLWEDRIPSLLQETDTFRDLSVQLPGREPYKASKLLLAASSTKFSEMLLKEDGEALSRNFAEDGEVAGLLLELVHGQEVIVNGSKQFFSLFNLTMQLDVVMCVALCKRAINDNVVTSEGLIIRLKACREDMLLLQSRVDSFHKAKPQMFSDVLLRVATAAMSDGGVATEELGVHSLVLAAASPYYRSLWAAGFAESTAVRYQYVDKHGIAAISDLVRFLYLGEYVAADLGALKELFVLADEYQVDDLASATLVEIETSQTAAVAVDWLSAGSVLPAQLEKAALSALGCDDKAADMPLPCAVKVFTATFDAQFDVQESLVRHARAIVANAIWAQEWTEDSPLNALTSGALQDIISPRPASVSVTGKSSAQIEISNLEDGSIKVEHLKYVRNEQADISVEGPALIKFTTFQIQSPDGDETLTIGGTPHSGSELPKDMQVLAGSTVVMTWRIGWSSWPSFAGRGFAFHVSPHWHDWASLAMLGAGIDMWSKNKLEVESLAPDSQLQRIVDSVPHLNSTLKLLQCLESSDCSTAERLAKGLLLAPAIGDKQAWGTCINLLNMSNSDGEHTLPKTLSNLCWDLALAQHGAMMSSGDAQNFSAEAVVKLVRLASDAEVLPSVMQSIVKMYKDSSSTLAAHLGKLPPIAKCATVPMVDYILRMNAEVPRVDAVLAPFLWQALPSESSDSVAKLLIETEGALPETLKAMLCRCLALRLCQNLVANELFAEMPAAATVSVLQEYHTSSSEYTWHVPDTALELTKGQEERSEFFRIGKIDGFTLDFYPRGNQCASEGKCSLFLSAPSACSISVDIAMTFSSKRHTEQLKHDYPEAGGWGYRDFGDAPSGSVCVTATMTRSDLGEHDAFDIADFLDELVQKESAPSMVMGDLYERACALQTRIPKLEKDLLLAIGRSSKPLESCLHVCELDFQKSVDVSPVVLAAAQKAARTALMNGQRGRDWGRLHAGALLSLVAEVEGEAAEETIKIILDEWASSRGDWHAEEPCEALPSMLSQKRRNLVTMAGVCSKAQGVMDDAGSLGMVQASLSSIFCDDWTVQDAVAIMCSLEEHHSQSAWLRQQAVRTIAVAASDGNVESIVPLRQVHLSHVLAEFINMDSNESISDLLSMWAHKGPEGSNKQNADDQLALLGSLPNQGALAGILHAAVRKFLDARPINEARQSCASALNQKLAQDCEHAAAILMEGAMSLVLQDMEAFSSSAAWTYLEPSAMAALLERSADSASRPKDIALQRWVEAAGSAAGFRALRLVKPGSGAFDVLLSAVQAHVETLEQHNADLGGEAYRKLVKENSDLVAKRKRDTEDLQERLAAANMHMQTFQKTIDGMQVALEKSVS